MPGENDTARLCMVNMNTGETKILAETTAWNFQQGSLARFVSDDKIAFNIREKDAYRGVILDIKSGARRTYSYPFADVSPDGKNAVSINFSRIFDFRPGYGYAGMKDTFFDEKIPQNDGIFHVSLESGSVKMLADYRRMWEISRGAEWWGEERKITVNHINYNSASGKVVFLLRAYHEKNGWKTVTMLLDNAGNMSVLRGWGTASHYRWKNEKDLLIYMDDGGKSKLTLFEINTETGQSIAVDRNFFTFDGHCSYSNDKRYILYDSYPDKDNYRALLLYDTKSKTSVPLMKLYSPPSSYEPVDIRCDLHQRFSPDNKFITFDSLHEDFRGVYKGVYKIDVSNIIK
jgi:hypothetical protein